MQSQPLFISPRLRLFLRVCTTYQELTKWDCIAGDGDCGTTFKRGAEALLADLDDGRLPKEDLRVLLRALSDRY